MNELYKVVYNGDEEELGSLYAISIVDNPANDYEFLTLSKQEEVKMQSEEKKLLTGVALVPNQRIKRVLKDGRTVDIFFDEATIEKLAQDYFINDYHKNATYNHNQEEWLDGITIIESWIIQDPENDKANALGFKGLPKGTWMVTMKLNDSLWEEYIKSSKAVGFSVDSYLRLEKINMSVINKNNKKEKMSLLKRIIDAVVGTETINLAQITIENLGTLTADAFEVDNIVYQDINGEMIAFADATFDYEGFTYTTDSEGKITSKTEIVVEEVNLETELATEYTTSDESKVYAEDLEIGKVVTDAEKQPLADATFEVDGIFYTTDTKGEVFKMEKNPESPLWVIEMSVEADKAVEEIIAETETIVEEVVLPLETVDVEALKAQVDALMKQVEILTKEKEAVLMENVELSKQPAEGKLKQTKETTETKGGKYSKIREIIQKNN